MSRPRVRSPLGRFFVIALLAACGEGEMPMEQEPRVPTNITVTPGTAELTFINETVTLSTVITDQDGNSIGGSITWTSSDDAVASVGVTGIVRAVSNGTVTITAAVGSISAMATVTVEQRPSQLAVVSGGDQEEIAGNPLPDPVVVRVADAAGTAVPGVTIAFTPNADHGTVTADTVVADATGEAETSWTLGAPFGPQILVASIDSAEIEISARAWAEDPTPDLASVGVITVLRPDPSSLDTMRVRKTVTNEGNLESGTFTVAALVDGVEVAREDYPSLGQFDSTLVELVIGPLDPGQRDVDLVLDPDGVITELNETNNELDRNVFVVEQTLISTGTTADIDAVADQELLFRVDVPPGSPSVMTVAIEGADGDADLFIEAGERPDERSGYVTCVGAGPNSVERCQVQDPEGEYHILLHAAQDSLDFNDLDLTITLDDDPLPFNLELVFVDEGTASQNAAFQAAAERWGEVLIGDIPDQEFTGFPVPADWCINGQAEINELIDDVRIYVSIVFIDGPLGILASAGACLRRHQSELPVVGVMRFDQADLERLELDGDMDAVVLHEMGHVLGLGTIWQARNLLEAPSLSNPGADTHFRGPKAIEAFDAAGGTGYTAGAKVPVENVAGPGSGDAHWRESVFDEEMMTPFLDGGVFNPLSAITVASLADLGYIVDLSAADPYSKDFSTITLSPSTTAVPAPGQIDLRSDQWMGPLAIVDRDGRIVEIIRR